MFFFLSKNIVDVDDMRKKESSKSHERWSHVVRGEYDRIHIRGKVTKKLER